MWLLDPTKNLEKVGHSVQRQTNLLLLSGREYLLLILEMPALHPLVGESVDAPNQYRQPSRKGKKAWRKNVDVTEVEKGLEDLNEEIIRGYDYALRDSLAPQLLIYF